MSRNLKEFYDLRTTAEMLTDKTFFWASLALVGMPFDSKCSPLKDDWCWWYGDERLIAIVPLWPATESESSLVRLSTLLIN